MKNKDDIVHELGLDPAKCTILILLVLEVFQCLFIAEPKSGIHQA